MDRVGRVYRIKRLLRKFKLRSSSKRRRVLKGVHRFESTSSGLGQLSDVRTTLEGRDKGD